MMLPWKRDADGQRFVPLEGGHRAYPVGGGHWHLTWVQRVEEPHTAAWEDERLVGAWLGADDVRANVGRAPTGRARDPDMGRY